MTPLYTHLKHMGCNEEDQHFLIELPSEPKNEFKIFNGSCALCDTKCYLKLSVSTFDLCPYQAIYCLCHMPQLFYPTTDIRDSRQHIDARVTWKPGFMCMGKYPKLDFGSVVSLVWPGVGGDRTMARCRVMVVILLTTQFFTSTLTQTPSMICDST